MGQKSSTRIVNPDTWSTRPTQLHMACGKKIVLSAGGSVAQRMDAGKQHKNGLVHTAWPVAVGRLFQVTILETVDKWAGSMGIGFTTISPVEFNEIPSSAISRPIESSPYHWLLWGSSIRHKKKRKRFHDLTLLKVGQTVGCLVTQTGELHFFVDGKHTGRGWTGLPVDKPLWGLVDVYGKCCKIKADILSDEIMVDRQLTETSQELAIAKHSLEQKDGLIQQLREQINQMDSDIQQLQNTVNYRTAAQRTQAANSPDFDKDNSSWYL